MWLYWTSVSCLRQKRAPLKTGKRKLPGFPLQSFAGWAGIPTSPPVRGPGKLFRPITLQPSIAIATCRKTCLSQVVLLQYKAKPYIDFQNLGCHCKSLGCHFDTHQRLWKKNWAIIQQFESRTSLVIWFLGIWCILPKQQFFRQHSKLFLQV